MRGKPYPLTVLSRRGTVPDLGASHGEGADAGLDLALRPIAVSYDALPAIRQSLFGELLDENRDLGFHGHCQHAPSPFSGDLGQWILNRFRLPERYDTGIVLHGVSLLLEVLAGLVTRHDTPPSQLTSPTFGLSSMAPI